MRLGFTRFLKLFFSSLFIQSSWSFFSMQAMGFLFSLTMGMGKDKRKEVVKTAKGFFNTHPYMAAYIIGAAVRAYDQNEDPEKVKRFVTIAGQSFASAGDMLFWQTIRPTLLLIAVILGVKQGIIGPVLFLVSYNIFHLYHRAKGIIDGYNIGQDVIYLLKSKRFLMVQRIFEILGALATGFLPVLLTSNIRALIFIPLGVLFLLMLFRRSSAIVIVFMMLLLIIIFIIVRL